MIIVFLKSNVSLLMVCKMFVYFYAAASYLKSDWLMLLFYMHPIFADENHY